MKKNNKIKGDFGEVLATQYLSKKGYTIIKTNYRVKRLEVDIIAQHSGCVIFIEVKYRENLSYGYPRESITSAKCAKIRKAALHYMLDVYGHEVNVRFDVIEIVNVSNISINHIEGAF